MAVKRTTKAATTAAEKKPVIRRKRTRAATQTTAEAIATRAYFLHLEGGHDPLENWLRAERELVVA